MQLEEAQVTTTPVRLDQDMMKRYLLGLVDQAEQQWEADFETRTAPESIAAYQRQCRQRLLESIGGLPDPCPLNARTTGIVQADGYTIEKVVFESQPGFHVTGLLYLPDPGRFQSPCPGVVVPVGHTGNGKAWHEYQPMGALLALNGMAGLVYDAIDESERVQYQEERGAYDFDRWGNSLHGTYGHQMIGIGSILLGRNTARLQLGDTLRAIDYLQARPEVDPEAIGCTGHSGGGIVTAYALALDERIRAAAPSCYLCSLSTVLKTTGPGDAEQVTWAALTRGPQPTDLLLMRAPLPTLLLAATQDQYFHVSGAWRTFHYVKRFYVRLGFAERFDVVVNDGPHNYDRTQREAVVRWMARWLLGQDRPLVEPPIEQLSDQQAQCTPQGQVMRLAGARSAYDLNEAYEKELAQRRQTAWATQERTVLLDRVRRLAGIRPLDHLPLPRVENNGAIRLTGYQIERFTLYPEAGIALPAMLFVSDKARAARVLLYVHESGAEADAEPGGCLERWALGGVRVLAVELRGTGRTQSTQSSWGKIGPGWQDITTAYCLGRSYVGMRAEDVLTAARHAWKELDGGPAEAVDLLAVGQVGVPALHAAALEPSLFSSVKLCRTLASWANVIDGRVTVNQYVNTVQGALREYDLPNLAAVLGDRLVVEEPLDAMGRPIQSK